MKKLQRDPSWYEMAGYESEEEYYFNEWCKEALAEKLIDGFIYHPEPLLVMYGTKISWNDMGGKKPKKKTASMLSPEYYSPDFLIYWEEDNPYRGTLFLTFSDDTKNLMANEPLKDNPKHYPFVANDQPFLLLPQRRLYSALIEIKPNFARYERNHYDFIHKQKVLLQYHGIYVNKVIPISSYTATRSIRGFFERTFTPKEYRHTRVKKELRALPYIPRLASDYAKKLKGEQQDVEKSLF